MSLSDIMDIATSGLTAQRARLTVAASNLANAETTRSERGGPYRRKDPVFVEKPLGESFGSTFERQMRGVEVDRIAEDDSGFIERYMPGHPDADEKGFVRFPNVSVMDEQTNILSATRSYEANVMVMRKVRAMAEAILRVGL